MFKKTAVSFWQLLAAVGCFLGAYLIVLQFKTLFASFIGFGAGTTALLCYLFTRPAATKEAILYPRSRAWITYRYGALSWLIAFPVALLFGKTAAYFMKTFYGYTNPSQLIAEQLLALRPYPLYFTIAAFMIVFVVPLVEELLFRGFLQNVLKNWMPRGFALVVTACLFTGAHFNGEQGLGNVEILITLFVLSLFLSLVYERWGNLLAPIALHQTFNLLSLIGLLIF